MKFFTGKLAIVSIWLIASQSPAATLPAEQPDFDREYTKAENAAIYGKKNDKPLLEMLKTYTKHDEQSKLHLRLGLIYNQQTGMVDAEKAVYHLSKVLDYDPPEKTFLNIMIWRGNSLESFNKLGEALRDYLRGLITCSYYDLSAGWLEIRNPTVPIYTDSTMDWGEPDPKREQRNKENLQRIKDYNRYRERVDYVHSLLIQRWALVGCVKRVQPKLSLSEEQLLKIMEELSPDTSRFPKIMEWIKSENKNPWP